ncbi:MAG: hypothetical protein ACE5I5_13260 [Candidatus Heimdallarchaeota archaeon]
MKYNPIPFLLEAPQPWITYNVLKNLIPEHANAKLLSKAKKAMMDALLLQESIKIALNWEKYSLKHHNDATHPIHRLELLVELGVDQKDPRIPEICEKLLAHQSSEGAFQTVLLVPKSFKGSGKPEWNWMTCDAPIVLYFLAHMGYHADKRVLKAVNHLVGLARDNGFGCHSSIPKFRGPGRKDDHCPYANLLTLKALAAFSQPKIKEVCRTAIQAQLDFWKDRGKRKIYLFGIGTDFQKLKYPNVYYNIIHVLDVLSLYAEAWETPPFREMLTVVNKKQAKIGSFTPESIWRAFNKQDFGQKKHPSPTLTYKIALINYRCGLIP